jgi:alpha-L-arabinofuranosidase
LGVAAAPAATIAIDPKPLFDISPWLYMQFMEPLGTTDSSVEASWDYDADDWRKDLVAVTRDLAPGMVRYGGNFSQYYKWREGVGPAAARPRMRNYDWGGWETNRVGTHEFVDFCRRVNAEPLYCVNFLSDGRKPLWKTREGNRSGDAREAADWVAYCNDPDHRERRAHGAPEPYNVKVWQIGNETSYGVERFTKDEAIAHTIDFAKAMRGRDRSLKLIGWGDWLRPADRSLWAADMLARAGEHLDYIAVHLMGQRPKRADTVLKGTRYQKAPEQAWAELIELSADVEKKIELLEQVVASVRSQAGIAVTEGHLSLPPHNANPILTEWLSSVYHARSMNIYQRHGDKVKIATAADFCGNRWTVNAVLMVTPKGASYLTPAGSVMRLFGRYNGKQGIAAKAPSSLDVAASRTGNRIWLHVANLDFRSSVEAALSIEELRIARGRVFEIAPEDPRETVSQDQPHVFRPKERTLAGGPACRWRFPARSVSAVELECEA